MSGPAVFFPTQDLMGPLGLEDVTYTRAGGSATTLSALVNTIATKEAARSNGVYLAGDITVEIDPTKLANDPRPRDTVTWNGRTYTVLSVDGDENWLIFNSLTCRCPEIAYDLRDTVTISRPNPVPGSGGHRSGGATTALASSVSGRLQEEERTSEPDTAGRFTTRFKATVYLVSQVKVQAGDFVTVSGVTWEVESQRDIDSLGLLSAVSVSRVG